MSHRKEVDQFLAACRAAGCRVERPGRGGHWKVFAPDGKTIEIVSVSPKKSGLTKSKARLRRAGVKV